ncbi:hypothetical protein Pfo_009931 [Paulownia fortunei]|nr:hypothetical protein Pfo_009931 [Paulownia fortunei]
MAPGRKRGAKGVKTKSELSLGDLVLAKVKGFPAWPAKISRPEDWERAPDPKKYFVQFFGTSEIAFVAPADIQAFTSEAKNKLSARCQGKTVRYFAQAVKEICEEFDVLQRKKLSGIRDDNNAQNLASVAHSVDRVVDEALEVSENDGIDREGLSCKLEIKGLSDLGSGFERSQRQGEMECQDVKPCSSDDVNHSLSPHLSLGKRSKLSTNPTNLVKESVLGCSPSSHAFVKGEGSRDIKVEGWYSDGGQSELTNGHQPKLAMGPKRKHEGTMRRNSGSVISHEHIGDETQIKYASGGKMKISSADNSRLGLDVGSERKGKKLLKEKKHSEAVDDGRVDTEVIFEEHNEVVFRKKMKFQHDHEKQTSRTIEASCPAKTSKSADIVDDASMLRTQTSRKNDSRSPVDLDDKMDHTESKRLISCGKAENPRSFRAQRSNNESSHSTDEDDLPPTKRHRRAAGVMSSSALISENRAGNSASRKNGLVNPNKVRSPVMQLPTKRRAVRLCDDDDDELPKTPIHGGFSHKVSVIPRSSESKKKNVLRGESYANDQLVLRNSGIVDDALKEQVQSSRLSNKASSPTAQQAMEKRTRESSAEHVSPSPRQLDSEKLPFMEAKPVIVSPERSPRSITATRPLAEPQKKHFSKAPGSISQKKVPSGTNRGLTTASDRSTSSLNQSISERSKSTSSGEKRKTTPKSDSQINDSVLLVGNPDESMTSLGERLDVGKDTKTSFPVDLKISDSVMSMKHLIAAAQARKRQAHLQNSYGNPLPLLVPDADMLGRSPSPTPGTLAVESNNTLQLDVQGLHPTSPSFDVRQFSSISEHENEELEERRVSSGHQATGSSLSGGTEAAVARDAFEGMIETLSRTKESIGRATRLAIDCAKYGIANEVVELLIRKLENEPSFHRKVDLFFLVDSITQCSHSQKGIAGASYIPTVQAALPRLIGAAAPPGTGAHENRRQCHKVLRLWLERKILPESVLRRYMDDIGAMNDDTSAGFSQRRPSRAERAIDDPIREMEGMLVDEYGSNATFQLPGLLSSHLFEAEEEEDEDNFPTKLYKEVADTSPSEHTPADPENCTVTPSDRRHCILEDVDGELEMEDVSGHQKDERALFGNGTSELASLEPSSDGIFESASNMSELLPSPEGSPPLPPGSPPVTPPLPTSPPPPPPLSSPSPPPPPPPPPPSSQQLLYPPPPIGPPPFLSQQSLPPQPALMSQHMPPLPTTLSSSQPLAYHPPRLPHEIGGTPTGNQHAHMVSNSHGSHIDAPVRGEVFSQQSSFFSPAAVSNPQEHVGYNSSRLVEYGQSDAYLNPQAPQQRQPFLPGSAPFAQIPLHPEPPSQRIPSQFSYPNSAQQNQYPAYSLPNFSDGPRTYATDEQWRMQVNEFNADCPRGGWMIGGRSCSGPPYSHEGYFGPPPERPPASVVNFQPSAANSLPAAPISGHGVPMMPCRPEMSAVNWRPA